MLSRMADWASADVVVTVSRAVMAISDVEGYFLRNFGPSIRILVRLLMSATRKARQIGLFNGCDTVIHNGLSLRRGWSLVALQDLDEGFNRAVVLRNVVFE